MRRVSVLGVQLRGRGEDGPRGRALHFWDIFGCCQRGPCLLTSGTNPQHRSTRLSQKAGRRDLGAGGLGRGRGPSSHGETPGRGDPASLRRWWGEAARSLSQPRAGAPAELNPRLPHPRDATGPEAMAVGGRGWGACLLLRGAGRGVRSPAPRARPEPRTSKLSGALSRPHYTVSTSKARRVRGGLGAHLPLSLRDPEQPRQSGAGFPFG